MSGWKWCGARKPMVAALGLLQPQLLHGLVSWLLLPAACASCTDITMGTLKAGAALHRLRCIPVLQGNSVISGHFLELEGLPKYGTVFTFSHSLQYYWVCATQENFLKHELPAVLL